MIEVLSSSGFESFDSIISQGCPQQLLHINFNDGGHLTCTFDHKVFIEDEFIEAQLLGVGDTVSGKVVVSIELIDGEPVYDLFNVNNTNSYYTNGILSHNCAFLYIDETAFVENWTDFYASTFPTISSGDTTKMLFTSTPNSLNHFYDFWKGATEGLPNDKGVVEKNGFVPIFAPWYRIPGRGDVWKNDILKALNYDFDRFRQEYECIFGEAKVTIKTTDGDILQVTLNELEVLLCQT